MITVTPISRPVVKSANHCFGSASCQCLSFVASSDVFEPRPRGAVARRHERGMGCGGRESVGAQVRSQGELNLVSDLQARKTNDVLAYGKTVWS